MKKSVFVVWLLLLFAGSHAQTVKDTEKVVVEVDSVVLADPGMGQVADSIGVLDTPMLPDTVRAAERVELPDTVSPVDTIVRIEAAVIPDVVIPDSLCVDSLRADSLRADSLLGGKTAKAVKPQKKVAPPSPTMVS